MKEQRERQTDWSFEDQYKQRCPLSWSSNDQMTQTFEMRDRQTDRQRFPLKIPTDRQTDVF